MSNSDHLATEQAYLDMLLAIVDDRRARIEARLREVRKEVDIDDPQGLLARDREAAELTDRLATFSAADVGLMFGRIDVEDPTDPEPDNPLTLPDGRVLDRRYIGRIGVHDTDEHMRTLLMDWRAPMARPFYLATALDPMGVHARRTITTRGRKVTRVSDGDDANIASDQVLMEAITATRGEHMRDIVATIAAEQDTIIRSPYRGITVVQGAPGTGKTAVALHRAAYVLYTWREQLAKTGVLIVGPNARFLEYISQVLPSLGETGVVLATPGSLLPGLQTIPELDVVAQEVKGSPEMLHILNLALQTFQRIPDETMNVQFDGVAVAITANMVRGARTRARRSRKPHNLARAAFAEALTHAVTAALVKQIGTDPLGGANLLSAADQAQLHDDIATDTVLHELVDRFWPRVTPEDVLATLYSDNAVWQAATSEYDDLTRRALWRPTAPNEWTEADAPLLDELADMIGITDDAALAAAEREQWLEQITEAQEALDILAGSASQDLDDGFAPEILMAYDVVDAESLAKRHQVVDERSTAQRAAADQRWAYGHIIVDEAQELSAMAWRMITRRSPNRWMTLVGDPAQTANPGGVETWDSLLHDVVGDRWQLHHLSVNYRTPADIAALATDVLADVAPEQQPPVALRETGTGVRIHHVAAEDVAAAVEAAQRAAQSRSPGGLVGVIQAADLADVKGLEFDEVILVEPAEFLETSPQGLANLYVALTRATQGLTIIHSQPLPYDW